MDGKSAVVTKGTGLKSPRIGHRLRVRSLQAKSLSMFGLVRFLAVFWLAAAVLFAFSDLMLRVLYPVADPVMRDGH
jgi:hypothetical protein